MVKDFSPPALCATPGGGFADADGRSACIKSPQPLAAPLWLRGALLKRLAGIGITQTAFGSIIRNPQAKYSVSLTPPALCATPGGGWGFILPVG